MRNDRIKSLNKTFKTSACFLRLDSLCFVLGQTRDIAENPPQTSIPGILETFGHIEYIPSCISRKKCCLALTDAPESRSVEAFPPDPRVPLLQ